MGQVSERVSAKQKLNLWASIRIDRGEPIEPDHVCCIDGLEIAFIWKH